MEKLQKLITMRKLIAGSRKNMAYILACSPETVRAVEQDKKDYSKAQCIILRSYGVDTVNMCREKNNLFLLPTFDYDIVTARKREIIKEIKG